MTNCEAAQALAPVLLIIKQALDPFAEDAPYLAALLKGWAAPIILGKMKQFKKLR